MEGIGILFILAFFAAPLGFAAAWLIDNWRR